MAEGRIAAHPDVVDTELDGDETVLLHLGTKRYFSLNATGTAIWQGLKKGMTADDIARELRRRFEVDAERAARSVIALVDELVEQQLATRTDEADERA